MTPEERELRRALDARSGSLSPDFRTRLSAALAEDRPTSNLMPALALVAAAILVLASVGVLLLARHAQSLAPSTSTPSATRGVLTKPHGLIPMPSSAQLSAPSSKVVWALVAFQYLYRSTDRGATWEQRPLPASTGYLPDFSFVSDKEGWFEVAGEPTGDCAAQSINVWHTTDAGATWQLLGSRGVQAAQCKRSLTFVDPNRGFLEASDPNHAPVIYRTTDAGRTWKGSQPLPDPPGFKAQPGSALEPGLVKAFGPTLLVPVWSQGGLAQEYVFSSTDGGATWTYLARVNEQGGQVGFVTASRWLKLIGPGISVETTDSGASWHPYASDFSQAAPVATQFVYVDSLVGYGTVRGGITRTLDGGLHWTAIETPGTGMKVCC